MPTYEYECSKCGHRFDAFQSITAEPLTRCPACNRKSLRRLIGAGAGIIFKGSGFYVTDYARKSSGDGASGDKASTPAKTKDSTSSSAD